MKDNNLSVSLNQLMLDPNNYRLDYERDLKIYQEEEIVDEQESTLKRLEKEKLGELRDSIVKNGFLEMDRIVVRKLRSVEKDDLYLIVEGNRRAAALKGLIEDYLEGKIDLPEKVVKSSKGLSVVCIEGTDEEIKEFSAGLMGVRHVSGPKRWSGYQSARLIDERHCAGNSFEQIGALLGISDVEAGRRFRNYRAFQQLKKDDMYGDKILQKHYTLLSEFLSPSRGAREWLKWTEDKDNDVYEFKNKDALHRVYRAITSEQGKKAEITNVNMAREFVSAIEDSERLSLLESGVRLEDLPPDHSNLNARRKQIKGFLSLVTKLAEFEVEKEDLKLLLKIKSELNSYLGNGEDS